MTTSADRPYPPFELASRVYSIQNWGDPLAAYEELGAQTKQALLDRLPDGWSFEGKRVLDFGSGAGRTLRHFLAEAESAELWGADIDAPSIDWMHENLCPPLHAWRCGPAPPLGLELGSFDLAWAISVFTHLTDTSVPWLLEPQINNMSWAVLRKRDVELTTEDVERPEDDPREYLALSHNLRQLRRELEQEQRARAEEVASVRRQYERSLSWRITRPLRGLVRSLRSRRGR